MSWTTTGIKTVIYSLLVAVAARVYERGHVPDAAIFPYVVYSLGTSIEGHGDNSGCIQFPLEIDVMDHDDDMDTTEAENIMDSIRTALNRVHNIQSGFYMQILPENIQPNFPTPDQYTIRRNLRFTIKIFSKE